MGFVLLQAIVIVTKVLSDSFCRHLLADFQPLMDDLKDIEKREASGRKPE